MTFALPLDQHINELFFFFKLAIFYSTTKNFII